VSNKKKEKQANELVLEEFYLRRAAGDSVTLFWNGNSIRKRWKDGGFKKIVNDTDPDQIFLSKQNVVFISSQSICNIF
jgi:hypothetical protein